MKLFVDVREGTWPAAGVSLPSWAKFEAITAGSSAEEIIVRN
jgi:hypothetical protein